MKKAVLIALVGALAIATARGPAHRHRELTERRDNGPRGGRREMLQGDKGPKPPKGKDGKPPKGGKPPKKLAEEERHHRQRFLRDDRRGRRLGGEPTHAEVMKFMEQQTAEYCQAVWNATWCGDNDCVSKALDKKGWSKYDNFWAAYAWETRGRQLEILGGLAVVGFKLPELVDYMEGRSLGYDAEDDKTLTMWAPYFAKFCSCKVDGWDTDKVVQYIPMDNDADYWGLTATTSQLGFAGLLVELIQKNNWNFEKAGEELEGLMDKHCKIVAFTVIANYEEFTDGDKYWEEVALGVLEATKDYIEELAKEEGKTSDLPTEAQCKAGAEALAKQVGHKCASAIKNMGEDMKKAIEEEHAWGVKNGLLKK